MVFPDIIYGLVLTGGKSTRMGRDKGLLNYHGVLQQYYTYNLLSQICDYTFLSIGKSQQNKINTNYNSIVDEDKFKGPLNGILSAHYAYPKVAWLVIACDLPLMTKAALEDLIAARNKHKIATAYALNKHSLPEPLCAIWEAKGLSDLATLANVKGLFSPRTFLMENKVQLVFPKDEKVLLNANSKPEYLKALQIINGHEH